MGNELGTNSLRFEREGPIAWCTIDRPAARNALTPAMYRGIKRAVRIVNTDPDLAALIITGAGDVFRAGFIYALLRGWSTPDLLRFANAAAAVSCTRLGALGGIPTLEEVEELAASGRVRA